MKVPSILLAILITGACMARPSTQTTERAAVNTADAWTVSLNTTGGFTGKGLGAIRIDTAGKAIVTDLSRSCEVFATDDERSAINSLIAAAEPESWREAYVAEDNPNGYADMVEYSIELSRGDRIVSTRWHEGERKSVPPSLLALADQVWRTRAALLSRCAAQISATSKRP